MRYYIEVTILPNSEIPLYFLWEKVYQQLHLALVETKDKDDLVSVGISFPNYNSERNHLGNKIRCFAKTESDLLELNIERWLARCKDYVHITKIRPVPATSRYAVFKRIQEKSSVERLARRKAKREGISQKEAMVLLSDFREKRSDLPYIRVNSLSSAQKYRVMIGYEEVEPDQLGCKFNTYGLSKSSGVPIF